MVFEVYAFQKNSKSYLVKRKLYHKLKAHNKRNHIWFSYKPIIKTLLEARRSIGTYNNKGLL